MTQRAASVCLAVMLAGCDRSGWAYQYEGFRNSVAYEFGDKAKTSFVGTCDAVPVFLLRGGDYPDDATQFQLTVDAKSWDLEVSGGHHGRFLFIDEPEIVSAIRSARIHIEFRVGGWQKQLKPHPYLIRFVDDCIARRKADPDAKRWWK